MLKKELGIVELKPEEMTGIVGGAGELAAGWEEQVRNTCIQLKALGKTKEYAVNMFKQMQPDHPEIGTYILDIWDSV